MSAYKLYQMLAPLRHVHRFQRFPVHWPQSVAEHSYYTALLAHLFAHQVQHQTGVAVDLTAVVCSALWHDAAEARTGDIPHDVKRSSPELHGLLDHLDATLQVEVERVGGLYPHPRADSLEALLVKLADWTDLLLYSDTERQGGNAALAITEQRIWVLLRTMLREKMRVHGERVLQWYDDQLADLATSLLGEPAW